MTKTESNADIIKRAREVWLAGLGIFSTVEMEGSRLYNSFVEKGKELEARGESFEKMTREQFRKITPINDLGKFMEERMDKAIETIGFTSQTEVQKLSRKVDELAATVDRLADAVAAQPAKTTPRTTRTKSD